MKVESPNEQIKILHFVYIAKKTEIEKEFAEYIRPLHASLAIIPDTKFDPLKIIEAFWLASYSFEFFKTEKKTRTHAIIGNFEGIHNVVLRVSSIYIARDLVNLPPNEKHPKKLVSIIESLDFKQTKIRVLDETFMKKESFGMLLAVAQWSDHYPRTVIFEQKTTKNPEYAFIWKGVTFDAGGLQIKSDEGMFDMKCDMAWAAAVIATMWYLDKLGGAPVIGAIWLVENLLGGNAYHPLDIVRAHNGKTVEIHHTDAEWRLVLWDVASFVSQEYAPKSLITVATLTGACMAALGYNYAGLSGTNEALVETISLLSEKLPEKTWKLPLDEDMRSAVKADIADVKNVTKSYKAGSSMGAAFIREFIQDNIAYAHLDIAGPAYRVKPSGIYPSEWTGFWVYTLSALANDSF